MMPFVQLEKADETAQFDHAWDGDSPFFPGGRDKLIALSVRHATPQSFSGANTSWAGGLVSYGKSLAADFQMGVYVGRVL
jgi:hypothetical protein